MGWERETAGVYRYRDERGRLIVQHYRSPNGKKPTWIPGKPNPSPQPAPLPTAPLPIPPPVTPAPNPVPPAKLTWGLDTLGCAKYEELMVQQFPAGFWGSAFSSTFGDARRVVERTVATGRPRGWKIQLAWKDNHQFSQRDFPAIAAEAKKWRPIVERYPIQWGFSGACENLLNNQDASALRDIVLNELPGVIYIQSGPPIASSPRVWNEVHQPAKGNAAALPGYFSFSFDGADVVNENITGQKLVMAGCQVFWIWTLNFNGNKSSNAAHGVFVPREQRRAWPTVEMFDSMIYLAQDRGATGLGKNCIWKTHSEQYADVPAIGSRDNKPVLIIPGNAPSVGLYAANGQVVASARRYGPFSGIKGTSRYYFYDWGFILAEKAKRIQGNPVVQVIAGGKSFGFVNPGFRDGTYK